MTYLDQSSLANDGEFAGRLGAVRKSEASLKPATDAVADWVLTRGGVQLFMPLLSASPGFAGMYAAGGSDEILDPETLSAVQANGDRVADLIATP